MAVLIMSTDKKPEPKEIRRPSPTLHTGVPQGALVAQHAIHGSSFQDL